MNSFRSVERAIESEIERQIALARQPASASSRRRAGWDEVNGVTHSMRSKEEAHDYRYFPDPDLVPLEVGARRRRDGCGPRSRRCRGSASSATPREYGLGAEAGDAACR